MIQSGMEINGKYFYFQAHFHDYKQVSLKVRFYYVKITVRMICVGGHLPLNGF